MPQSKKPKGKVSKTEEDVVESPLKKKSFDFPPEDELPPVAVEKVVDEDGSEEVEVAEDSADISDFDPEELDPFKDKWEE